MDEQKREKNVNKDTKLLIIMGFILTIPLVIVKLLQFYNLFLKDKVLLAENCGNIFI